MKKIRIFISQNIFWALPFLEKCDLVISSKKFENIFEFYPDLKLKTQKEKIIFFDSESTKDILMNFRFSESEKIKIEFLTFKPEKAFKKFIQNNFSKNLKFKYFLEKNIQSLSVENKIEFVKFSKKNNFQDFKILDSKILKLEKFENLPFKKNVVQFSNSASGEGTFLIENENDFQNLIKNNFNRKAKITEFVDGQNLTINGCVMKNDVFTSFPFAQITGIGKNKLASFGSDFSFEIPDEISKKIMKITKKIGKILNKKYDFRGIFGIDFLVSNHEKEIFVIEINPRLTANLTFMTEVEKKMKIKNTLSDFHFESLTEIQEKQKYKTRKLQGFQIYFPKESDLKTSQNFEKSLKKLEQQKVLKFKKIETHEKIIFQSFSNFSILKKNDTKTLKLLKF